MHQDWLTKLVLYLVSILLIIGLTSCANDTTIITSLHNVPQNNLAYLNSYHDNYLIKTNVQRELAANYLNHYYLPWTKTTPINTTLADIKQDNIKNIDKLLANPGWGPNMHKYSAAWAKRIAHNANLASFPNLNENAITVNDSAVRVVPSIEPSFTNLKTAGEGYPFDNLQQSFLPAGTPLHIFQVSRDGAWYLITTSSFYGWVQQKNIAFVDANFIKNWQTKNYVVSNRDNIPAFDQQQRLRVKTRIGALYPLQGTTANYYKILTAAATANKRAIIKSAYLPKQNATLFPQRITAKNIALTANQLLGDPYGWGGLYGYRDCSATTMDIMATFGIWLPRNSSDQIKTGNYKSLAGLNNSMKEHLIINQGIPLLTLIHMPGHITIYVGEKNGLAYIYHDMWGLITLTPSGYTGRAVIGSTVITPIRFGRNFANVHHSLLDAADGMTTLVPPNNLSKDNIN